MEFFDNFKRICKEKGTTPTALVKKVGLSSSKATMWKNGALPKSDVLIKLAKELNCSVMDFFDDNSDVVKLEPINNTEFSEELTLDEDERDIIRIYRSLSRKTKHEFMIEVYTYENKGE